MALLGRRVEYPDLIVRGNVSFLPQLVAFARTIRLSHSLFALPFALGTAMVAEPPVPAWLRSCFWWRVW